MSGERAKTLSQNDKMLGRFRVAVREAVNAFEAIEGASELLSGRALRDAMKRLGDAMERAERASDALDSDMTGDERSELTELCRELMRVGERVSVLADARLRSGVH
jgi:hypothetical protein